MVNKKLLFNSILLVAGVTAGVLSCTHRQQKSVELLSTTHQGIEAPQELNNRFTLTATTPDELNGQVIHLVIGDNYSENRYEAIDSTLIQDNGFSFSRTIDKPCENAVLLIKETNYTSIFNFVISRGENKLVVRPLEKNTPYYKNILSNSIVQESEPNIILRQLDSLSNVYHKQYAEPDKLNANILILSSEKRHELTSKQLKILEQYPDSYYSLIALYYRLGFGLPEETVLATFSTLQEGVKSSPLGQELYQKATKRVEAKSAAKQGKPVPEFSVKTAEGSIFENKSLLGKPYVIAFSATWCVPCKVYEMKLKTLYSKYKDQGLEVVYFNLDDDDAKWKAVIDKNKLTWINVSESTKMVKSEIAKKFYVRGIPLYILVDKKGTIAYNADEVGDEDYGHLEKYIQTVVNN